MIPICDNSRMELRLQKLGMHHRKGGIGGIFSVCSSHPAVLRAVCTHARETGDSVLVEATANQVNQFGGYTGMRPDDFTARLHELAETCSLPASRVVVGADHLGPHVWKNEPARQAVEKAAELARLCVEAGFHKIHVDTGAGCADDPTALLPPEVAAERAAAICLAAEAAAARQGNRHFPLYVIGAEVPPPGGSLEAGAEVAVTSVETVGETLHAYEKCFRQAALQRAWKRVVAVVVQPGVEFGDEWVAPYRNGPARELSAYHGRLPEAVTYEIHSTDYQGRFDLEAMVRDHFPLLKVGPCLTNAFREAVFSLVHIEREWLSGRRGIRLSHLREVVEAAMMRHPEHWQSRYAGSKPDQRFLRSFSLRDRVRYYWGLPAVTEALHRLQSNLDRPIPHALLSQYFPDLCPDRVQGALRPFPQELIDRRIRDALQPYAAACR